MKTIMLKQFSLLLMLVMCSDSWANTNRVFVSNERGDSVTVFERETNKVIGTISVGKRPRGVGVSPDGKEVYVAVSMDNLIAVIDPVKLEVIRTFPCGDDPEAFAVHPNGNIYISNEEDAIASVYDPSTGKLLDTIEVGLEPEGVAISPDGSKVAVTSESTNLLHIIGIPTHQILNNVVVGARPRSAAFSLDNTLIYVTSEISGEILKIDANSGHIIQKTSLDDNKAKPKDILISTDGKKLYVAGGRSNKIFVLNEASLKIENSIPVGKRVWGLALSKDGKTLYTTDGVDHQVSVIDTSSEQVTATVPVGKFPWGVAIHD